MTKTVQQRVIDGIELLDKRGPEHWRERVNTGILDVASIQNCVLGQVYGVSHPANAWKGWAIGMEDLFGIDYTTAEGAEYGFEHSPDNASYEDLSAEWRYRLSH